MENFKGWKILKDGEFKWMENLKGWKIESCYYW